MTEWRSVGVARWIAALVVTALLGSAPINVQAQGHGRDGHALGKVDFAIAASPKAQVAFNRAVALLHHMTYPQARKAFEDVVKIDPKCAMAHWGIAVTLFQPLWPTRPSPADLQRGWEEVQRARALDPPSDRERLFVEAAAAFFKEPQSTDYWLRIRRWEQAMEKAYTALPQDPEVTSFYALSHLAVAPQDRISRANADRAAELLLGVLARNPDHPGAMHYIVHANDVPGRESESFQIVEKYEMVAPRNPHALHMPTHIYTRRGDWDASIRGNRLAADAALEYPAGDRGQYVWDEFPHAVEYMMYAMLQEGDDVAAAAQLKRLHSTARLDPTFKTAFHHASTNARYVLERHAWKEAVALVPREPSALNWDRFWWPEAVTWFARGFGAARIGDVAVAREAVTHLESLEAAAGKAGEALFARNIQVLRLDVAAWTAHAEKQTDESLALMREAAELEESTPKHSVTPGPTLPARELLGDLLLELERPAEALEAYTRSLELYPRRFHSLLGAARSARATGDETRATNYYAQLLVIARGTSRPDIINEARTFLAKGR